MNNLNPDNFNQFQLPGTIAPQAVSPQLINPMQLQTITPQTVNPSSISQPTSAVEHSENAPSSGTHLTVMPVSRIKKIMKEDKDLDKVSADAVFCTSVACEAFIAYFVKHAYQYCKKDNRKTLMYKDLVAVVKEMGQFDFLDDIIPLPVPIKEALEEREKALGPAVVSVKDENVVNNNDTVKNDAVKEMDVDDE